MGLLLSVFLYIFFRRGLYFFRRRLRLMHRHLWLMLIGLLVFWMLYLYLEMK